MVKIKAIYVCYLGHAGYWIMLTNSHTDTYSNSKLFRFKLANSHSALLYSGTLFSQFNHFHIDKNQVPLFFSFVEY